MYSKKPRGAFSPGNLPDTSPVFLYLRSYNSVTYRCDFFSATSLLLLTFEVLEFLRNWFATKLEIETAIHHNLLFSEKT